MLLLSSTQEFGYMKFANTRTNILKLLKMTVVVSNKICVFLFFLPNANLLRSNLATQSAKVQSNNTLLNNSEKLLLVDDFRINYELLRSNIKLVKVFPPLWLHSKGELIMISFNINTTIFCL